MHLPALSLLSNTWNSGAPTSPDSSSPASTTTSSTSSSLTPMLWTLIWPRYEPKVYLTMAHRPVGWLWIQRTPEAMQAWGQEEHATSFVLRVLNYLVAQANDCRENFRTYQLVEEVYRQLCVLQSLVQGNGVWVVDAPLQEEVRTVLLTAMEEVQRCDAAGSMVYP
ncbi:hypothetical protein N657DRAFT_693569 [Parathielavia appendiculata]|uniref:Uncharacterized protein n=1 Tax=Parathielavia appendiculata TaxID=2587402 RepID=A0AAN6TST0_9PEZI|nr:hypothetical protein N657DRAFT_693569 [Parathielavia appendiculata]